MENTVPAGLARLMEPYLEEVTEEVLAELGRQIPDYVRIRGVGYLREVVGDALRHFTRLVADPDASWAPLTRQWREIGAAEAAAGRSLHGLESAVRATARVAWQRMVAESDRLGLDRETLGTVLDAILAFMSMLTEVAREGHGEAGPPAEGDPLARYRRRLLYALVEGTHGKEGRAGGLAALAHDAEWPIPAEVAVVLLRAPVRGSPRAPVLPDGTLADLDRHPGLVLLADPEAPGRMAELAGRLGEWTAVVGPAVPPRAAGRSRRWAVEALALLRRGALPAAPVVRCADHMPALVVAHAAELLETAADRRLAPLRDLTPAVRARLAETLLMLLRCRFNATKAAAHLGVHPQTVRLRLQKLQDLFGDAALQSPGDHLELQMLLQAGLLKAGLTDGTG